MDDEVVQAVEKVKEEWDETYAQTQTRVKSIEEYGKGTEEEGNSLQRLNGLAQDGLALLRSLQFRLDLLAPQMPTQEDVQSAQLLFKSWKDQYQSLHLGLRNANLQAKANIRKKSQSGEGTSFRWWRRIDNTQTQFASMYSLHCHFFSELSFMFKYLAISFRSSFVIQTMRWKEVRACLQLLMNLRGVLKKAESEYKGHRSFIAVSDSQPSINHATP
ncbi:hypothetical protein IFM89_026522 [Coptis chinensis]|uniref:Uncharacterized protein n=1 Tax=Coptis chinensis TaxID=261450 RepID=A0A835IFX0_9MAGN|nr:hypothetical protein IFM89_026522 [Coptis chinensis]